MDSQAQSNEQLLAELTNQKFALDEHAIVATTDRRGDIIYVNDKFCQISQYSREELLGQNHRIINSSYHPKEFFHDLWKTITSGQVWRAEICNRAKDGSFYWVDTTIVPFRDTQGRIEKYVSIRTDVTSRKQVELELQETISDLEAKNAEMERFLYTVSHDLRSPIVTTKGFLGLLQRDIAQDKPDKVKSDVERIDQAIKNMEQLLEDLLELSRVGRVCIPSANVPLEEVVKSACDMLHGPLEEKNIRLEIAEPMPTVFGDRTRLVELVQNIVENAIKYMGDQPHPQIQVTAEVVENMARLSIRDNGIGIEEKYIDKIFGLFDQLDPDCVGTGIGLALVKRIAEYHGGAIYATSEGLSKGSTFVTTLPLGKEGDHDEINASAGRTAENPVG